MPRSGNPRAAADAGRPALSARVRLDRAMLAVPPEELLGLSPRERLFGL
ncbi:MAG: hypothetical protein R3C69_07830 [Geminicoccaceae bacterium]